MSYPFDGKKISSFLAADGFPLMQFPAADDYCCKVEEEYLGTYSIIWAVKYHEGKEVRRWNLAHIPGVEWAREA